MRTCVAPRLRSSGLFGTRTRGQLVETPPETAFSVRVLWRRMSVAIFLDLLL